MDALTAVALTRAYPDSRAFNGSPVPAHARRRAAMHARNFPARYWHRTPTAARRALYPRPEAMSN